MKTKHKHKTRLYGKHQPRMPKPVSSKKDKGFSLRLITTADARYAVVKQMQRRLKQLMAETGVDSLAKELLCGRAVFVAGYLESQELDALEGKQIDYRKYFSAVKSLTDVLKKLGLDKEVRSAKRLETYIAEGVRRNGKH